MLKQINIFLIVCFLTILFMQNLAQAAPANTPKSGQTVCYNTAGAVVACAGTGQDGDKLKGVIWPAPRFTDNGDLTVTDDLTGLMWTQDGNAPGPVACTPGVAKTWQEALDYVTCLNTNNYRGYNDWRLPNINELESLVNAGQANTATWLNTQGFNNVQDAWYRSSSTYATNTSLAWVVSIGTGGVYYNTIKTNTYRVWPVRAGQ